MRIQVPKCSSQTYTTRRCTGIVCTVVSVLFLLEIGKMIFNYIFGVLASFAIYKEKLEKKVVGEKTKPGTQCVL